MNKTVTIRMPAELYARFSLRAWSEKTSMNALCVKTLKGMLDASPSTTNVSGSEESSQQEVERRPDQPNTAGDGS